jgi:hypothetical protein
MNRDWLRGSVDLDELQRRLKPREVHPRSRVINRDHTDRNGPPMARRTPTPTPMRLVIDGRDITDHVTELHLSGIGDTRRVTAVFDHPNIATEDGILVFTLGRTETE